MGDVLLGRRRAVPAGRAVLPDFWELVVLGVGCGLVAFGAIDRSPGPAWLGFANLVVFVVAAGVNADDDDATGGRSR